MVIGLDLATRKSGIIAVTNDKNIIYAKVLNTEDLTIKEVCELYKTTFSFIELSNHEENTCLGLEISNYGNAKLTQKFSLFGGIVLANFYNTGPNGTHKIYNAAEWFIKLFKQCYPDDTFRADKGKRYDRKRLSVEQFNKNTDYFFETKHNETELEDLADAFGVQYFYKDCLDTDESYELHKGGKKTWKKKNLKIN